MGLDPGVVDQQRIVETLARHGEPLTRAERRAETVVSGAFVVAVAILIALSPPAADQWHPVAAVACFAALVVALRAEFDAGAGFTVPSQLAFVPLLFTLPPALVPVIVVLALVVAYLPDVIRGELLPARLLRFLGSAWFSVGPAAVLCVFPADSPAEAGALVLAAALVAQLMCDFGAAAAIGRLLGGAGVRDQLREGWVYAVDLALTPVGLVVAWHVTELPLAVLAVVPLLVVLGIFGRERRGRVQGLLELNNAYRGTALLLSTVVEADDHYTAEHSRDVVDLALDVGRRVGLGDRAMHNLEFAALLHDVGKMAIPKTIINKPDTLDPEEWAVIKTHTIEGQRMLDQVGGFMSQVGTIVRSHHERWDGAGYPDGLAATETPIEARIIAACDTWNAMTTTRPYRAALPASIAAAELRRIAGAQLDPQVVEHVLSSIAASARVLDVPTAPLPPRTEPARSPLPVTS